jgi:hypothetical protein
MSDNTAGTSRPKRKANAKALEIISSIAAAQDEGLEVSSDENGQPKKRSKGASGTANPTTKDAATPNPNGTIIGTVKKGDDHLPVRVFVYGNKTLNYRVDRQDCSAEVAARQASFLTTKRQVQLKDIVFDAALFPPTTLVPDIQKLSEAAKKDAIRLFLRASSSDGPDSVAAAEAALSTPQPALEHPGEAVSQHDNQPAAQGGSQNHTHDPSQTIVQPIRRSKRSKAKDKAPETSAPETLTLEEPRLPVDMSVDLLVGSFTFKEEHKRDPTTHAKHFALHKINVYAYPKQWILPSGQHGITPCYRIHESEVYPSIWKMEDFPKHDLRYSEITFNDDFAEPDETKNRANINAILAARLEAKRKEHPEVASGKSRSSMSCSSGQWLISTDPEGAVDGFPDKINRDRYRAQLAGKEWGLWRPGQGVFPPERAKPKKGTGETSIPAKRTNDVMSELSESDLEEACMSISLFPCNALF